MRIILICHKTCILSRSRRDIAGTEFCLDRPVCVGALQHQIRGIVRSTVDITRCRNNLYLTVLDSESGVIAADNGPLVPQFTLLELIRNTFLSEIDKILFLVSRHRLKYLHDSCAGNRRSLFNLDLELRRLGGSRHLRFGLTQHTVLLASCLEQGLGAILECSQRQVRVNLYGIDVTHGLAVIGYAYGHGSNTGTYSGKLTGCIDGCNICIAAYILYCSLVQTYERVIGKAGCRHGLRSLADLQHRYAAIGNHSLELRCEPSVHVSGNASADIL